jgi:hypothetical protein
MSRICKSSRKSAAAFWQKLSSLLAEAQHLSNLNSQILRSKMATGEEYEQARIFQQNAQED